MTHIRKFNETVNEGIKDKMTPKSPEDIKTSIEKLSPYRALTIAYSYKLDDLIKYCWERVKPINEKLYQDTEKFDKTNILEFVDFVSTWIDDQGGESYDIDEKFRNIAHDLTNHREEEYEEGEWEDDEGNLVTPPETETTIVESIYGEQTVRLFKEMMISYVIDYLSHHTYKRERDYDLEEDEEEEDGWRENELDNEYDYDLDDYYTMVTYEISELYDSEGIEVDEDKIGSVLYNEFEDDVEEAREHNIPPKDFAETMKSSKRFIEALGLDKKSSPKETPKDKPISKIKKFLGFDKDDEQS